LERRYRRFIGALRLLLCLLILVPLAAQDQTSAPSSPSCHGFVNSVVPGACLGKFQHGTLVRKIGSGANEVLELANGPSGTVLTHPGVDLVADCGSGIYALADGVVVDAVSDSSDPDFAYLGYMVRLKHAATSTGLPLPAKQLVETETLYLHMQGPPAVQVGSVVLEHAPLGKVGRTGAAWGCHTHLEVRPLLSKLTEGRLGAAENAGHNHPLRPSRKAGWPLENRFP
jgi:murein DD-endopeptidase MepM/ murein hydrolase activator NlpD